LYVQCLIDVQDCVRCPALAASRRRIVHGYGDAQSRVVFIGEAPGRHGADQTGVPFSGDRSGRALQGILITLGLMDGPAPADAPGLHCFVTNVVRCCPPANRTPTAAEQAACAPFLERAIQLVQPKILLLVGGASAKSLLKRDEGILSLRGRWFEWTSSDGQSELPALPTLHPAFLLRQPAAKKKAWTDMLMLSERLDRPERPH
jgi:DNA polymerase